MKRSLSTPAFLSCAFILLCSYDKSKKDALSEKQSNPYDVIIVPGVPYQDPSLKTILKARMLWAKYLFNRGITKNIIFSGAAVYTPYVEGKVMKIYADSLGIPSKNTFVEDEAEHSTENIYYSVKMAREKGFKRIALATDHYQAFLLRGYIKKKFPDVELITLEYQHINLKSRWPEIDAEPAYANLFVSITERENRVKRFMGTMGKNIAEEQNDKRAIAWARN
jgi:uncharacterized SAM-binding protein YcdF (DUF218 family)